MKQWVLAYLTFSRKERWGVMVLIVLVLIVWLLPRFFADKEVLDDALLARADSVLARDAAKGRSGDSLYMFDPNQASEQEWVQLGLTARSARTVRNYMSKGGRFREPEDLRKIYGINPETANRLMPYVQIRSDVDQAPLQSGRVFRRQPVGVHPGSYAAASLPRAGPPPSIYRNGNTGHVGRDFRNRASLELNTADSLALEGLPLIGPKLSARILKFRDNCGGFYRVEQLAGVYGLSDSVYMIVAPMLRVDGSKIRKININSISADSLDRHPYVQKHEARAIEQFRKQHGPFRDTSDLARVHVLGSEWLQRMAPYLEFRQ